MQHVFIAILLVISVGLSAQPVSYIPNHSYESVYTEVRREKYKTLISDYEAKGAVKKIKWTYAPAIPNPYERNFQEFHFSTQGLLTGYTWNDTTDTSGDKVWNGYAESWKLYYDSIGNLDTIRIAEFRDDEYPDLYWKAYNLNGYLTSCGRFNDPGEEYATPVQINYVYTLFDSFMSVTTYPFSEYDITGNGYGDSVHFVFDAFGRVTFEKVFLFYGEEYLSFTWEDDYSFRYSIDGRSYMQKYGMRRCNRAGRLIHTTANGYSIDQEGTHSYSDEDSLVYNKQGWISAEYYEPPPPPLQRNEQGEFIAPIFRAGTNAHVQPRLKLHFRYVYTVDAKGNWITRSHYDTDGKLVGTETRVITYF